eukprot:4893809-Alexandrium_andersonii.AAC.1
MVTETSVGATSREAPIQTTCRPAEVSRQASGNPAAEAQSGATPTSRTFCPTAPPTAKSGSST